MTSHNQQQFLTDPLYSLDLNEECCFELIRICPFSTCGRLLQGKCSENVFILDQRHYNTNRTMLHIVVGERHFAGRCSIDPWCQSYLCTNHNPVTPICDLEIQSLLCPPGTSTRQGQTRQNVGGVGGIYNQGNSQWSSVVNTTPLNMPVIRGGQPVRPVGSNQMHRYGTRGNQFTQPRPSMYVKPPLPHSNQHLLRVNQPLTRVNQQIPRVNQPVVRHNQQIVNTYRQTRVYQPNAQQNRPIVGRKPPIINQPAYSPPVNTYYDIIRMLQRKYPYYNYQQVTFLADYLIQQQQQQRQQQQQLLQQRQQQLLQQNVLKTQSGNNHLQQVTQSTDVISTTGGRIEAASETTTIDMTKFNNSPRHLNIDKKINNNQITNRANNKTDNRVDNSPTNATVRDKSTSSTQFRSSRVGTQKKISFRQPANTTVVKSPSVIGTTRSNMYVHQIDDKINTGGTNQESENVTKTSNENNIVNNSITFGSVENTHRFNDTTIRMLKTIDIYNNKGMQEDTNSSNFSSTSNYSTNNAVGESGVFNRNDTNNNRVVVTPSIVVSIIDMNDNYISIDQSNQTMNSSFIATAEPPPRQQIRKTTVSTPRVVGNSRTPALKAKTPTKVKSYSVTRPTTHATKPTKSPKKTTTITMKPIRVTEIRKKMVVTPRTPNTTFSQNLLLSVKEYFNINLKNNSHKIEPSSTTTTHTPNVKRLTDVPAWSPTKATGTNDFNLVNSSKTRNASTSSGPTLTTETLIGVVAGSAVALIMTLVIVACLCHRYRRRGTSTASSESSRRNLSFRFSNAWADNAHTTDMLSRKTTNFGRNLLPVPPRPPLTVSSTVPIMHPPLVSQLSFCPGTNTPTTSAESDADSGLYEVLPGDAEVTEIMTYDSLMPTVKSKSFGGADTRPMHPVRTIPTMYNANGPTQFVRKNGVRVFPASGNGKLRASMGSHLPPLPKDIIYFDPCETVETSPGYIDPSSLYDDYTPTTSIFTLPDVYDAANPRNSSQPCPHVTGALYDCTYNTEVDDLYSDSNHDYIDITKP